jgi:outer membrane protein assembly factor BamE
MHCLRIAAALIAVTLIAGCITTYKMDIQQGNVLTQEMVDLLKPGLTRSQVRFVLGTPLVMDSFHQHRWDYYYSYKKGGERVPETRHLTVFFKNDALVSVQGDISAKPTATAAQPDAHNKPSAPATDATSSDTPEICVL